MRPLLLPWFCVLLIGALALPLFAQETADVSVGGGLVARLRDRGAFASVAERVANVDQKLVQVISSKDTQHPQVTVKQKGNLWTVYAWDIPVMAVYPAEAKTNQMTEKALAQLWAKNLTQQLPKATPCSKLPPDQLGYGKKPPTTVTTATKPTSSVTAKPTAAAPPAGSAKPTVVAANPTTTTPKPATTTPKPVTTTAKPAATTAAKPVALVGNEAGATLLIVDAMRAAREMNAEQWAAHKEGNAKQLYSSLLYYLTGQGAPPKTGATTTTTTKPATTTTTKPVTTTTKPATTTAKPATTATKPAPTTTATTKPATTTAATDPSMAKVPQKNRIRAKFAAAKPAYDKLTAADPEAAKPIGDMLAASRQAFAYGKFDESEQQVDAVLAALGVTFSE